MRTFIAIKIDPGESLLGVLNACRKELSNERIRWVRPDNIHITLKFLGDTPHEQIPEITDKIRQIAMEHPNFQLTFKGIGIFRNLQQPRVLWMGIESNPVLSEIKRDLEHKLQPFGFEPENREYRPHLTLGRIKNLVTSTGLEQLLRRFKDQVFQVSEINDIIYYESILKPSGPEYTVLSRMQLH